MSRNRQIASNCLVQHPLLVQWSHVEPNTMYSIHPALNSSLVLSNYSYIYIYLNV